jgi:immunoglobulin-like protein involved in spore germination/sporulation and spore germination protein
MTDPRHPEDDRSDDRRLSELLSQAVSDVEPRDALGDIRNRTRGNSMSARRPWTYAVGGAVVATAALVGAVAFAGDQLGLTGSDEPSTASHGTRHKHHVARPSETPSDGATSAISEPSASPATGYTLAGYYVGDTPSGPRLYREFDHVSADNPLTGAMTLLETTPQDPDYTTPWGSGSFDSVSADGRTITVTLADAALHDRPSGMSEQYAEEAIQQVVYTLQAAAQDRLPVQFVLDGNPVDQVLGVPTSEPVSNASVLDTLSHVSLSTPSEGQVVSGGTLRVDGVANSFEANVVVRVQRYEGTEIVAQEPFTAEGWMGDKLFPFSGSIDLSGVPAGKYVVMAMTDDPSGGAEGSGAFSDTRIITVQ